MRAFSEVATQRTAIGVAAPAAVAARSSHSPSRPAEASGSASVHASGTSCASSQSPIASSASAASSPSRAVAVSARSCASRLRARRTSASARSTPASTNAAIAPSSVSSASASAVAVRLAAAAGLLSSCARPADIWPSAASFSRWSWLASSRAITGPKTRITFWNAGGVANSRSRNRSAAICAARLGPDARIATRASLPDSARIAPIQVGASWWWSRSSRPSTST